MMQKAGSSTERLMCHQARSGGRGAAAGVSCGDCVPSSLSCAESPHLEELSWGPVEL